MTNKRHRVSKRIERLARALCNLSLKKNGYPDNRLHDRVDESWMVFVEDAEHINNIINWTGDALLTGYYTDNELTRWN